MTTTVFTDAPNDDPRSEGRNRTLGWNALDAINTGTGFQIAMLVWWSLSRCSQARASWGVPRSRRNASRCAGVGVQWQAFRRELWRVHGGAKMGANPTIYCLENL